jgi:hypothetical protein
MACLFVILRLSPGHHNETLRLMVPFWIFYAAVIVLIKVFVFWDVNSDGLRGRRLWNTKEIAWPEVTHVGAWDPKQPLRRPLNAAPQLPKMLIRQAKPDRTAAGVDGILKMTERVLSWG